MFRVAFAAMASAWLVGAQEVDDNSYHPHAAFAFVRTGERTPVLRPGSQVLTALGANQMYQLGQNFRTRYITGRSPNGLGVEHITNMSQNVINNDQILVQTNDAPHLVASALAFTQGLYPPVSLGSGNTSSGSTGSLLANGRAIDFPLGGYQYASIQASGNNDPEHIYVAGAQTCPIAERDAMQYFVTPHFQITRDAHKNFYQDNFKVDWFEGNLKQGDLSYTYAMEIADYMQYQYAHNSTINRAVSNSTLATMQALADQEAWYLWGNTSSSSTDADNQAISGKTLASVILGQFQRRVIDQLSPGDKNDMSYPLTFLFGESEPFISLISLMMADFKDEHFRSIPPYGSAMIFELFSTGNTTNFPTNQEDLWVRFYFHNGTSFDAKQLIAFPIFGNGPSRTDVPWLEFQDMFGRIMMNSLTTWCSTCASSALFCTGVNNGNMSIVVPGNKGTHKQYPVSPVVSGVIGAIVTLVVAGLVFGLAILLGGFRLHRVHKNKKSELGGFKGSAKLASDPDLGLAKNAAVPAGLSFGPVSKKGHERVESWELRHKEFGPDVSRRESMDGIDALTSAKPVQPVERV